LRTSEDIFVYHLFIVIETVIETVMTSGAQGYLELILGSMFSGKTSYLLDVYKKCVFCNIPVAVINYAGDNRYTTESMLSTHDKQMIPCMLAHTIKDAIRNNNESISRAETILINEGQFFPDIEEEVRYLVEQRNKRVYICGLDGDFNRKPIGNLLQLIPFSDHITKLKSLCSICRDGTPGVFSFRITNETDQVIIGSSSYLPLCRGCYQREMRNKNGAGAMSEVGADI
jgi:thymidine kinase